MLGGQRAGRHFGETLLLVRFLCRTGKRRLNSEGKENAPKGSYLTQMSADGD
jgi:hypothetical protein